MTEETTPRIPVALTIAGSDSGGGAGIQADLKAFSALGVYGASVITALTAQNTRAVTAIADIDPGFIRAQLDAVFDDIAVDAVKIGMLSRPEVIDTVADVLAMRRPRAIVLDPVMVAKSGDKLLGDDAVSALRERLLPLATLVTPNLPEAAVLLDQPVPDTPDAMEEAGRNLIAAGARSVLMKGGHLPGDRLVDILITADRAHRFEGDRVHTVNTHGTGCTLSSAIAAELAKGSALDDAVATARRYLMGAIQAADRLGVGGGHGPVHHFHALWSGANSDRPA